MNSYEMKTDGLAEEHSVQVSSSCQNPSTSPVLTGQLTTTSFEALFEVDEIQRIQDEFSAAMGVASIITRPDGTPITRPSNFTTLCNQVIRQTEVGCANCYKSDAIIGRYNPSGPIIQPCKSGGLWDAGASITVDGHHIANWLVGQVRDNTQTDSNMRAYARVIGADESSFMEAFEAVPSMSRERFGLIAQALFTLANELSTKAFLNVQQNKRIAEHHALHESLQASETQFKEIFDEAPIGYHEYDATGRIVRVNHTELAFLGYAREEMLGHFVWEFLEDRELTRKAVLDKLAGLLVPTSSFERNYVKKDGSLLPVLIQDKVLHDGSWAITGIRSAVIDISERKQAEERINRLAFYDQLTDLPNRTLLQDRLNLAMASSQRSGSYGALLLIDLDYFKTLNDTLGHDMGDLLLKQVAARLSMCVREEDTVARQGGDEFVVVLVNLGENQSDAASRIEMIGEKICAVLTHPYELKEVPYRITTSIGASAFLGQRTEMETLLKQADLAMYKAKEAGRNTLRFFDPDMEREVVKRVSLNNDLREAVQRKQFLLHFQAQVSGNQVTGAEVLLRWQHPERGLVFPGDFIPAIEENGLILTVGQWVLESACRQLAIWSAQPEMSLLSISVNISARQLNDEQFVDHVLRALEESGANPQLLKLELTETVLINNIEDIIEKMATLKAKGLGFALDDFGTGYSSLFYLKHLPLDQLKIDQSFVRDILVDPNDAVIARTIVVLAESLGLVVMAEGVETVSQREALNQQGCHNYQGYLFSPPLPVNEFESFVKRFHQEGENASGLLSESRGLTYPAGSPRVTEHTKIRN